MGEISMFGSGEGLVWVTGRGYSTTLDLALPSAEGNAGWYLHAEMKVGSRANGMDSGI